MARSSGAVLRVMFESLAQSRLVRRLWMRCSAAAVPAEARMTRLSVADIKGPPPTLQQHVNSSVVLLAGERGWSMPQAVKSGAPAGPRHRPDKFTAGPCGGPMATSTHRQH